MSKENPKRIKHAIHSHYWNDLLNLLHKEAKLADEPSDTARLFQEIGNIYFFELDEKHKAQQYYEQGLEKSPDYIPLLRSLEQLAVSTQNRELFFSVSNQLLDIYDNGNVDQFNDLPGEYIRLGQYWLTLFDDSKMAASVFEKALKLENHSERLIGLLTTSYENTGNWNALQSIYQIRIEQLTFEKSLPIRVKLFYLLFYKLNNPEEAVSVLEPVIDSDPDNYQAHLLLSKAYLNLKLWDKLSSTLATLVSITDDKTLRKSLLLQRAEICHIKLQNCDAAEQCLNSVLEIEPSNRNALERLAVVYRNTNTTEKLVEILEKLIEIQKKEGQNDDFVARVLELARLYTTTLDNNEAATEVLKAAVKEVPNNLPILTLLAAGLKYKKDWAALKEVYETELANVSDNETQAALYYRLGALLEDEIDDLEAAVDHYQKAVAILPSYLPATQRLGELYAQGGRWSDLISLLENEIAVVDNERRAVTLLHRIATIQKEHLDEPRQAISTLLRVHAIEPEEPSALTMLGQLYEEMENWHELVEIRLKEAKLSGDPAQAISLFFESGQLCEEKLDNNQLAMMCYQNILSISPTYIPALQALGHLYAISGNWAGLIAMYHREAQVTSHRDKRLHLMLRTAEIYKKNLNNNSQAESVLIDILRFDPNYFPATRLLEEIYLDEQRYQELASLYKQIADHVDTHQHIRGEFALKLAKLLDIELSRTEECEAYYLLAIDHDFGFNTAIAALDCIYSHSGRFEQLAQMLESVLKKVKEPSYLFNIIYRLAIIQLEYLNVTDEGLDNLFQAYKMDPDNLPLFWDVQRHFERFRKYELLGDILQERAGKSKSSNERIYLWTQAAVYYAKSGNNEKAVQVATNAFEEEPDNIELIDILINVLKERSDYQRVASLLRQKIQLPLEASRKIETAMELSRTLDEELNKPEEAASAIATAIRELDLQDLTLLANLERLYLKTKNWEGLQSVYPQLTNMIQDPDGLKRVLLRQGECFEQTDNITEALATYKKILAIDVAETQARSRIRSILEHQEDWAGLVEMLNEDAHLDADNPVPLHEIAKAYDVRLNNLDESIRYEIKALERSEDFLPSYLHLSDLYLRVEQIDRFIELTTKELQQDIKQDRIVFLRLKRGALLRDELTRPEDAAVEFEYGLKTDKTNETMLLELATTYERLQKWQDALKIYDTLLNQLAEKPEKSPAEMEKIADLYFRMGSVALDEANDEAKCIESNEKALEFVPHFAPSLEKLEVIYEKNGDWTKLTNVYKRSIEACRQSDPTKVAVLQTKLGEIFEDKLKNPRQAIQEYLKGTRVDNEYLPTHQRLANIYSGTKQYYPNAIQEYLFLIKHDPEQLDYLKSIAKIYEASDKFDHLCRVFELMDCLGVLDQTSRDLYNTYAARIPKVPTGNIDFKTASRFVFDARERQPLFDFVSELLPLFGVFGNHTRDSVGVTRKDKVNLRTGGRLAESFNRACEIFELEKIDFYLKDGLGRPSILITNPSPGFVLDKNWSRSANDVQVNFVLGHDLSLLMGNRAVALQLESSRFEEVLRITLGSYLKSPPQDTTENNETQRLIKKALNRKIRKSIDDQGEKLAPKIEKCDFSAWIDGIKCTAYRFGMLYVNKMAEVMHYLAQNEKDNQQPWQNEMIRLMTIYFISDEAAQARRAMGTSIYSV